VTDEVKEEPREGIQYKLHGAEVIVDTDQASLIVEGDKILDPMAGVTGNVVDIKKPRAERVTKTEKAAKLASESNHEASDDELPM
jgi:hypothetical protein